MESATIRLRVGTLADISAMHALDLLCFDERFSFDLRAMEQCASEPGAVVLVAEAAGCLAGFAIVAREGARAYVSTLDVDPRARRLGVAGQLMRGVEARLAGDGVEFVGLHVFAENSTAIRFYELQGYMRGDRVRGYYGRGLDALMYEKRLRGGDSTR